MYCIYHNADLDGFSSGAIVKYAHPDVILIGHNYGDPTTAIDAIPDGEEVVVVDVTVETPNEIDPIKRMAKMFELSKRFKKLTWIDHHKSAIETYTKFKDEFNNGLDFCQGHLEVGKAACELTWKFFFPDEDTPPAISLLGAYDVWRHNAEPKWDEEIYPFQMGMRLTCSKPERFPTILFEGTRDSRHLLETILEHGKVIVAYQKNIDERTCHHAFEAEIGGLRAICVNAGGIGSIAFQSVYDPEKHDVMVPFTFNGRFWKASLYTTNPEIDCSAVAKSFGGGGHRAAAGFQTDDIFKILKIKDLVTI